MIIFDRYVITAMNKTTKESVVFDEVLLFGLFMYMFIGGFYDPTNGQGKLQYNKIHTGIITKVLDYIR